MDAELGPDEMHDNPELLESDDSDFQEPIILPDDSTKRKIDEVESEEDEEDVGVCGICQKEWTNNGLHCIVQMKCGHCFGRACVFLYKRDNSKNSKMNCPVCGQITTKREIRKIWPTKLFPEKDEYINSLKFELEELDKRLEELALQNTSVKRELEEKRSFLDDISPKPHSTFQINPQMVPVHQTNEFCFQSKTATDGEFYNVVDLNPWEDMAVVSTYQYSKRRYGFRKINMYDSSVTEFIPTNHQDVIRDIKHSTNNTILSTGDDETLKLTSIATNLVVQSYQLDAPSRACSFDDKNTNLLYCGLKTGALMIYDVRNTRNYLSMLVDVKRQASIISVIPQGNSVICTDRDSSYLWTLEESQQDYTAHSLYISDKHQGKSQELMNSQNSGIYSANLTDSAFCTSRNDHGAIKHTIHKLVNGGDVLSIEKDWSCTVKQENSSIGSSTLFTRDDKEFLCYVEQNSLKIRTRDEQVQAFTTTSPILDIKHTNNGFNEFLVTLSKDALCIYKCDV